MACTANNDIPRSVLLPSPSNIEQIEAIGMLKAYIFITERDTHRGGHQGQTQSPEKVFDVHPLVYLARRGWLKANNQWGYWANKRLRCKSDMDCIFTSCFERTVNLPEVHGAKARMLLLDRIGCYEWILERYKTAEKMFQETLALREKILGKEHPETLTTMNSLALTLSDQEKYAEAEKMHRETLAPGEKVSGKERPETLTTMNNLALTLNRQGSEW
ncbi:hypothetical protein GQ43DRAFT_434174 [Delitschia confertaspora ATCC 74209]|uniref:Tetratricopeptide repeat protein n=1 Tax=Delitschia confertaspora ATCC 74209 TaxID=1513339 RepID=A0A9P4JIA7_9PLEO|nr:hypothetical protein GQ43DRAFT_434174 [Delitschia confertaspora ATCC 74209]